MLIVIGNAFMGLSALALFWFTLRLGRPAAKVVPVMAGSESGPRRHQG